MTAETLDRVFAPDVMKKLFHEDRADAFFDALLGDASEGAYDIDLKFIGHQEDCLVFEFQLRQRPGKCLVCNLTYGLPAVFSRHPVINVKDLVAKIDTLTNGYGRCTEWELGQTREISSGLHAIPLTIVLTTPMP